MADEIDIATALEEIHRDKAIQASRQELPPLHKGTCASCGEPNVYTRHNDCTPCRQAKEDEYGS